MQLSVSHVVLGLKKGESEASRKASWRRRYYSQFRNSSGSPPDVEIGKSDSSRGHGMGKGPEVSYETGYEGK